MSFRDIIVILCIGGIFVIPIVLTILNVRRVVKKRPSFLFELIAFSLGMVYLVLAYALLEPVHYSQALFASYGPVFHEAFSRNHIATLIVLWLISLAFYFILKFIKKNFPPIIEALLLSGVYVGIIISILVALQLVSGFGGDTLYIVTILYMYLFLGNYFLLTINLLLRIARRKAQEQRKVEYKNKFLQRCNEWLVKGSNLYVGGVILLLPLLVVIILLLTLFGQEPDSVIKAFTQTSDWVLSTQVSPPPLEYSGHYLCTVSLRGHKKLVKPVRYGIRGGKKIVVNRQLCIANAFEQLILERAPRFHKVVRNFYDTYGYPLSKLIRKPWIADVIYLIMKPLEWLFLLVLYTFDAKPEDRIARQYLPQVTSGRI